MRNVIEKKGTLHALHQGVDESGSHFDLCFFPPAGGGDAELEKLYQGNFFQVLRDEDASGGFRYSLANSTNHRPAGLASTSPTLAEVPYSPCTCCTCRVWR